MQGQILVVDDDESILKIFDRLLSAQGLTVRTASTLASAVRQMEERSFDLIFGDILLGEENGLDLLETMRKKGDDGCFIVMTAAPTLETAQKALQRGAYDYLVKPVHREQLVRLARTALDHKLARDEKERLRINLEAIFHSVDDALVTVDAQFNLLEVNEAATRICGLSRTHSGNPFIPSLHHCRGGCRKTLERVFATKTKVHERHLLCQRSDRPEQLVNITATPLLNRQGAFAGAVMAARDETRLASLERHLGERRQFHRLIGQSPAMQRIYAMIEDLSDVETTVLVTGESGTGKELVAEAIHHQGRRAEGPLIKVNCAALSETILESELFGHVRGAFTGAIKDKVGRFQAAHGGTIFLDEIGDVPHHVQVRLLRVLQEKEIERVGDSKVCRVDSRVVTATNQNLKERVEQGAFREDLFFRLKVVQIHLPPLRERREDIPLLVEHFIARFNTRFSKRIFELADDVKRRFMDHPWPGNIRELQHTIEHAFVVCSQPVIQESHLPVDFLQGGVSLAGRGATVEAPLAPQGEREQLVAVMEASRWRRGEAAKQLGVSRSTLYRWLRKYGLDSPGPGNAPGYPPKHAG